MDKFMESPWFLRIVALVLALMLYASVNVDGLDLTKNTGSEKKEATVTNIPVEKYYDEDNLTISGVPKSVSVNIKGPISLVQNAKSTKDFQVYADMSHVNIGKQTIKLKVKGLSDKIKATIKPASIKVNVQEKVTNTFTVEPQFNSSALATGYEAGSPTLDTDKVKITGAKTTVSKIAYVKATVNAGEDVDADVSQDAQVQAFDSNLNKLNVSINPSTVKVSIPVSNPSKTVPITVNPTGKESEDTVIESISTNPKKVTIYGTTDTLKDINNLSVDVDISKIEKDQDLDVSLDAPKGVNKMSVRTITAHIKTSKKKQTKTLSNIKVEDQGLDSDYTVNYITPKDGEVDVTLNGDESDLKKVNKSDVQVLMNVSGLSAGEHTVNLQVKAPNGIKWELPSTKATVRLDEKTNATTNSDTTSTSSDTTTESDNSTDENS